MEACVRINSRDTGVPVEIKRVRAAGRHTITCTVSQITFAEFGVWTHVTVASQRNDYLPL